MEALIDNGDEWMEPLMEFREMLVAYRDDPTWRDTKRRNGLDGIGPYLPEKRAEMLEKLLLAQKAVQETQPDVQLISNQEIVAIQLAWYRDFYFKRKASEIYNSIYKTQIDMSKQEEKMKQELDLLKESCGGDENQVQLIQELLALQKSKSLMMRKRGLQNDIEKRIEKELNIQVV